MHRVILLVDQESSAATGAVVAEFRRAIAAADADAAIVVLSPSDFTGTSGAVAPGAVMKSALVMPLTLDLPPTFWTELGSNTNGASQNFPDPALFAACRDIAGLRQQVAAWDYATGSGDLCLPIVLTAKGPLYGEVIGTDEDERVQPIHLDDALRQSLYALGQRLLRTLSAPPAVYLMQFAVQFSAAAGEGERGEVYFDRLLPFPDEWAIASVGRQEPDLFTCHWRCLTQQPIRDLVIQDLYGEPVS